MKPASIETVASDGNLCGEGPLWDFGRRLLLWVDLSSSLVFEYSPATGEKHVIQRGLMVAGIALDCTGDLVFAGAGGLHLWSAPERWRTLVAQHDGEPLAFNDLIAAPRGRIFAGTVYWGPGGMEKRGKLYSIEGAGATGSGVVVRVVEEGLELANGLGLSPDDSTLYLTDSAARRVYAYDHDAGSGELHNRRVFVAVPRDEGIPDGLTVDAEGFVWSAQWYGGQVVRYDPDGTVERRIALPVLQISSLAFGGDDLGDLYVTTATEAWPSALAPRSYDPAAANQGGSLYRVRFASGDRERIRGRREHLAELRPSKEWDSLYRLGNEGWAGADAEEHVRDLRQDRGFEGE
jgi:D-xylonolactonase